MNNNLLGILWLYSLFAGEEDVESCIEGAGERQVVAPDHNSQTTVCHEDLFLAPTWKLGKRPKVYSLRITRNIPRVWT